MEQKKMSIGTLLNAYPDSIGGKLADIVSLLKMEEFKDTFQSFYIRQISNLLHFLKNLAINPILNLRLTPTAERSL